MRRTAAILLALLSSSCGADETLLALVDARASDAHVSDALPDAAEAEDATTPLDPVPCVRGQSCGTAGASCSARCGPGPTQFIDCYCDAQLKIYFCEDQYCPATECPPTLPYGGDGCTPDQIGLTCTSRTAGGTTCRCTAELWECVPML